MIIKREVVPEFLTTLYQFQGENYDTDTYHRCLVLLWERFNEGMQKYGVPLTTHNGRDAMKDAWEEVADLCQYLTQAKLEGKDVQAELDSAITMLMSLTEKM
jgi:hypothetical protein